MDRTVEPCTPDVSRTAPPRTPGTPHMPDAPHPPGTPRTPRTRHRSYLRVTRGRRLVRTRALVIVAAAVSLLAIAAVALALHAAGSHPREVIVKSGYQNPPQLYQLSSATVRSTTPNGGIFGYVTPSKIGPGATREECVEAFIATAFEYLGTPYVWNYACAPGVGVDCAGLVLQCMYGVGMAAGYNYTPWEHYNVPGHDAYADAMRADPRLMDVPLRERERGDLICYPGHISIYLGNDQVIEALPPDVHIASMWEYGEPVAVKRVFA